MRTRTVAFAGLLVAAALIAGLAANLLHTQSQGRETLRDGLERRAILTASLIGSAFNASTSADTLRAQFGGPAPAVERSVKNLAAASPDSQIIVLGSHGRLLAATPGQEGRVRSVTTERHVRAALHGARAISDAFSDARGRLMVEIASPFATPSGRRVALMAAPVTVVRQFAEGFFASASAIADSQGYLLDDRGLTLAAIAAGGAHAAPDRRLRAELARRPSGSYVERTYVSARVPYSRWRVVLSVPSDRLYASVDGAPRVASWELFAAFTLAILGLVALGFAAARGAQRLTAAKEREEAARRLAHERLHDALTSLPNRTLFNDRAQHALAAARRNGRSVAVLFMDIDHFKRINDSLGHEAGDEVLCEVARRVSGAVRVLDTVSRFGGDEFVVLCDDLDDSDALRPVGRIQECLAAPVVVDGRDVAVTFSIGVAIHDATGEPLTAAELVRNADTAMYRAKDRGRGRVEVFDDELHREAVRRLDAEVALRDAIRAEEFVVHYQPIVALPDGQLHGVEALVRWQRPDTGKLVPPGDFIPLAEQTGLILELGEWVLRASVREVGDWARSGLVGDSFELSVNVSARQLADPRLPEVVAEALTTWDRPASRLCLEITESAVMADPAAAERTLERLHALGVRLAIDDFGVGHSSLGQLARAMRISVLKLDRSFVAAMSSPRDRGIVQAAAALARALDLSSVAEGVESPEQAAELSAMGFPYAQGFHFGRPVEGAEVVERLNAMATAR
jgi:diguanylate cyclase (GGDEF)-like protein